MANEATARHDSPDTPRPGPATTESAVTTSSAARPSASGAEGGTFKISRKSVPGTHVARPLPATHTRAQAMPQAQHGTPPDELVKTHDTRTHARSLVSRSPSHSPERTDAPSNVREPAAPVSREVVASHPATRAQHSSANFTTAVEGRARALSGDALKSSTETRAPLLPPLKGHDGASMLARKHRPKRSAFTPHHTPFQRRSAFVRPTIGGAALSDAAAHRHVNGATLTQPRVNVGAVAAVEAASDGSFITADNFALNPSRRNGAEHSPHAHGRDDVRGNGIEQHSPRPTILRQAHTSHAPLRRVESHPRAEAALPVGVLMRKAASTVAVEGESASAYNERPVVMRQASAMRQASEPESQAAPSAAVREPATVTATTTATPPDIDLAQLAEQVSRIISRRLAVERERRGLWK